jgi:lysophospholipase L1-like esterase
MEPIRIVKPVGMPTRTTGEDTARSYVRFAALGDSVTFGLGDPVIGGVRGWASLLAEAIGHDHDVSFCNLARPGATTADVRAEQLASALSHRPHIASLIAGLDDAMRSTWDPRALRRDLFDCAGALAEQGALLLTVRFHDHTRVLPLPRFIAIPMRVRIEELNTIYDEIHSRFGGLRVDLAGHPGILDRDFWSVDRLHPSELGHRCLAEEFAALLTDVGLLFEPPALELDGCRATAVSNLRGVLTSAVPWVARRARDWVPAATRQWILGPTPRGLEPSEKARRRT